MNEKTGCSRCGKPVARDDLMGLCEDCLLAEGLGSVADATASGHCLRFVPPEVSDIAPLFAQLEVLEPLGCGGMGAVYKARQKKLDRFVALKILPPDIGRDPAFAARFTREAKALAKLNHPNIVTIHDFGQAGELFYFLMEYVDGVNLGQLLRSGRVSPREALAIVPQICDALQYAHDAGIVHRDIKPENILLDRRGRVKVADFGLAKLVSPRGMGDPPMKDTGETPVPQETTQASLVMGTPQYMAPEQVARPSDVDPRADIYSLGVVFYQMLTGELPKGDFAPPSKIVVLDVRLDEVVLRAMEKRPELRYQQVSDVKTMVETIASEDGMPEARSPQEWKAPTAGWGWFVGQVMGITFTSQWAYKCANLSALGSLGALGFLGNVPLPGWQPFAAFFGFSGFFGLIGIASLVERLARRKQGRPKMSPVAVKQVQIMRNETGHAASYIFLLLYVSFVAVLVASSSWLPERVATHFRLEGKANGWMGQGFYLVFIGAFPILIALVFAGVSAMAQFLPAQYFNLPRRDFWLAPKQRATTVGIIRSRLTGLLCLITLFFAGLHGLTIAANRSHPPRLSMDGLLLLVVSFLVSVMIWMALTLMRFAETGEGSCGAVRPQLPITEQAGAGAPTCQSLIQVVRAHLTTEEKSADMLCGSLSVAGILFATFGSIHHWPFAAFGGMLALVVAQGWHLKCLASTEYAKQRGVTLEQLRQALWTAKLRRVVRIAIPVAVLLAGFLGYRLMQRPQHDDQRKEPPRSPQMIAVVPKIERVVVSKDQATITGQGAPGAWLRLRVGDGSLACTFSKRAAFTATYGLPLWGNGLKVIVKEAEGGKPLLTHDGVFIGPMTKHDGRIFFLEGSPTACEDGSYLLGEFRPTHDMPSPVSVSIDKSDPGRVPQATEH